MSVAQVIDGRLVGAAFLDDPRLRRVLDALDGDGEEARVVGGAVRNALMGEPVTEVDVATTATPDVMLARAKHAGLRAVPTGIDHGTITFIADGEPFEATTLREDVETHGRHATVRFGRDFEADALRRDFTFNALSVDADGRLHDYTGGVADARARRVRFIGDAATRIREDYLRILRFFRFQAAYGDGEIDPDALHAAISLRAGMEGLSRERVLAELVKLLAARGAPRVASLMAETGILIDVTGGVVHGARLAACAAIADARTADPALRLAAACVIVREDAERLRARLRLSNAWENRLVKAADALTPWRGRPAPPARDDLQAHLFTHGREAALDALTLAQSESGAPADAPDWAAARAFLRDAPEPRLPFSGSDLLARGLPSGPGVGAVLKDLQAAWIRAGFPREPETLARLLEDALAADQRRGRGGGAAGSR